MTIMRRSIADAYQDLILAASRAADISFITSGAID